MLTVLLFLCSATVNMSTNSDYLAGDLIVNISDAAATYILEVLLGSNHLRRLTKKYGCHFPFSVLTSGFLPANSYESQ
jgi:hypothetical protein